MANFHIEGDVPMHPVRIFDGKGKLKKEISAETLVKKFWDDLYGEHKPIKNPTVMQRERTIICAKPGCGKKQIVFNHNAKYCSKECASKNSNFKITELRKANKVYKNCKKCGKQFIGFANRSYCNDPCNSAFQAHYKKNLKKPEVAE